MFSLFGVFSSIITLITTTMAGLIRLLQAHHNPPADPTEISFTGKTVLLTGATSGLGFEAAIKFLNLGVDTLIIGSRTQRRGEETKAELEKRTNRLGVIQAWELEMDSFESVKAFARRVDREILRLDVALLNAGLWNREHIVSCEGWEQTLQVNTLSTSFLALLLLPKLRKSASVSGPAHLTVVSSQQFTRIKAESLTTDGPLLKHLNSPQARKLRKQYGISKLLLEYVVKNIASLTRNDDGTVQVIVNSVSPGFCASSLVRQFKRGYERWFLQLVFKIFARTAEQGSRSLVSATVQGVESHGRCWRSDGYLDELTALTVGEEGEKFRTKAWREILDVLRFQAKEIDGAVGYSA